MSYVDVRGSVSYAPVPEWGLNGSPRKGVAQPGEKANRHLIGSRIQGIAGLKIDVLVKSQQSFTKIIHPSVSS